jgi:4-amino-4-deoxychorismate lyase
MFWYNGELIAGDRLTLNLTDSGLLYGASVFTTLRVYQQSLDHPLTHWEKHGDRLRHSLEVFGWSFPDWKRVRQGAELLCKDYPVLRIVIFEDGREWITGRSLPKDLRERQLQGIMGWVATDSLYQRSLNAYKTGNYLGSYLAQQGAQKLGLQEAILIDSQGNWLETSTGNLWGWKDGCWWTPVLDGTILPGIARSHICQTLTVKETVWTADFVSGLAAIAYSNSVVEIIPFRKIINQENQLTFNPSHPALEQLISCYSGFSREKMMN